MGRIVFPVLLLGACTPLPPQPATTIHPSFVSLNPCADAVLVEVADPAQVRGLSHFSREPGASSLGVARARRFASNSGTLEEIVALHPDIVIGDAFTSAPTAAAIERMGMRLERYQFEPDVATSLAQVRRVAALAGHPERGEALVRRIEASLAAAAPPAGEAPVSAVVWQSGGMVPGSGTLIADLLRRTGFRQLSAVRGMRQGEILPLELMLADPPQVILATGNPLSNEDRALSHPALRALRGTRRERLDPSLLWCGGPTIVRAAGRLAQVRRSVESGTPLPLAGGVWGGPATAVFKSPPPAPPAGGRGDS